MTLNATSLREFYVVKSGFVVWQPPRALHHVVGKILLTPEVDGLLKANDPYFPRAEAAIVMSRFCSGQFLTVARTMEPEADLKRLVDVDEVWALAFRKPRSFGQGRLLGRFLERDVFVGLGLYLRDDLAGDAYSERADDAVALWQQRIKWEPVRSDDLEAYLSSDYRDLDSDE